MQFAGEGLALLCALLPTLPNRLSPLRTHSLEWTQDWGVQLWLGALTLGYRGL